MRYTWALVALATDRIELVEENGLCITNQELHGGWQCYGNGMLTVLRQLVQEGWTISSVREDK